MESRRLSRSSYVSVAASCPDQVTLGGHIQRISTLHPCACRETPGEYDSTLSNNENRNSDNASEPVGPKPEKRKIMPLIQLLEVLIVVGILLWLVNRFIPMQGSIKSILNGVVVIAVVLWLLNVFGLFHSLSHIRVGT
jgi:hypothetical protein